MDENRRRVPRKREAVLTKYWLYIQLSHEEDRYYESLQKSCFFWKELGKCCGSDQQVGQREFEGQGSAEEEVTWQVIVGLLKHKGARS